jgi:hypothetical protein
LVISRWQATHLGDSKLLLVGVSPVVSPRPSLGESVQEEAARAALKEGSAMEVPMHEKRTKVSDQEGLVLMRAAPSL